MTIAEELSAELEVTVRAEVLALLLTAKFGQPPRATLDTLYAATPEQLDIWTVRFVDAENPGQVFWPDAPDAIYLPSGRPRPPAASPGTRGWRKGRARKSAFDDIRAEAYARGTADILELQLTAKFGQPPKATTDTLCAATQDQLDIWADRILDAESPEQFFGPEAPHAVYRPAGGQPGPRGSEER